MKALNKGGAIGAGVLLLYLAVGLMLYFFQELILFQNTQLPNDFTYTFENRYKEVNFVPAQGVLLNGLIFETTRKPKRGVVLYFHGNADDLRRWGKFASQFTELGYDVWMYDYRQFGKSQGPMSELAYYEDADYVYARLLEKYKEEEIVLYGYSLGSGIATYLAAKHAPARLILEAPYYSFVDLAERIAPIYPYKNLLRYQFPTHERIGRVACPILLVHGTDDELVPYTSSEALIRKAPQAQLKPIMGGKHKNLADYIIFRHHLAEFLTDSVADRSPQP